MSARLPRAGSDGVDVVTVGDELVVHVAETAQFHRLSPRAAEVWRACDGRTTRRTVQRALQLEDHELDGLLAELVACRLVQPTEGIDRRLLLARTGVVAGGALITTIVAPQTWAAASPPTPDPAVNDPSPGAFASFTPSVLSTYTVTIRGAAGGGGAPSPAPGGLLSSPTGASGASLTATVLLPPGVIVTVLRGGGGGGAAAATDSGAGGASYVSGYGGTGGNGGGGGGAASGLLVGGLPLIIAGGGGGGGLHTGIGGAAPDTQAATGGPVDGGSGRGGGGGGGATAGAAGATPTAGGAGGTRFVAPTAVNGATATLTSHNPGAAGATLAGAKGADGSVTFVRTSP